MVRKMKAKEKHLLRDVLRHKYLPTWAYLKYGSKDGLRKRLYR